MNLCATCGLDFTSSRDFDSHRVGTHAYTYAQGLRNDPPLEDGRRCLDVDELHAKGWALDRYGRWRRRQRSMSISVRGSLSAGKKRARE